MTKKLTITIADDVYEGLHRRIGRRKISRFLEMLARPHVMDEELESGYLAMAGDTVRETEALEWIETTLQDVSDEPG
jgi:predicted CopG family antitoxin